jgi:hypothetical protein
MWIPGPFETVFVLPEWHQIGRPERRMVRPGNSPPVSLLGLPPVDYRARPQRTAPPHMPLTADVARLECLAKKTWTHGPGSDIQKRDPARGSWEVEQKENVRGG